MNVKIYSKMAVRELIRNGFPENVSVISFYTPVGLSDVSRFRIDYSTVCDSVFYVGVPDIDESGFSEYGYTDETFLSEADDLADFIFRANIDGRDIICQCDFGTRRSAACAAAIWEFFEGRGNEIFLNDRYSPNLTVFNKVFNALCKKKKLKTDI